MRNIISALLITNKNIDVNKIKGKKSAHENKIDIKKIDNCDNIINELNEFKGVDVILTIGDDLNLEKLYESSFEVRKKWCHFDDIKVSELYGVILNVFQNNIKNRSDGLFSIFVSSYNTDTFKLKRLYDSLCGQTYNNWNLWVLDDSTENNTNVFDFVTEQNDYRIHLFKNCTHHGNIGFNKHTIAMMCDGDYLLEMDHDDYLTPDCLELVYRAFKETNSDFVYSYVLELINNKPVLYGDKWGFGGYGGVSEFDFNGKMTQFATTPDVNAFTIRTIFTQPNHLRCWRKDFYHKIGGHNISLSVLDDQEILIKTFLNGKMCKIPKVLYIQDEGDEERGQDSGSTAQSFRFKEIQRTTWLIKDAYDKLIHERILDLGHTDSCWDGVLQCSILNVDKPELEPINEILVL